MIADQFVDITLDQVSLTEMLGVTIDEIAISPLLMKQYTVEVPGTNGTVDLSDWFGSPRYESRTLSIAVSCFRFPFVETESEAENLLLGKIFDFRLSIKQGYFYHGKVTQITAVEQSATGAALILITAICDPYCYADRLTEIHCDASSTDLMVTVSNSGTMPVSPEITAEGDVHLTDGASVYKLCAGTFQLPGLVLLGKSDKTLTYSGAAFTIRFREAVL